MDQISNFHSLSKYGFDYLTSERCAFGQRALFNLTRRGLRIFCEAFGIPWTDSDDDSSFAYNMAKSMAAPWGSGPNLHDRDYMCSVMIAHTTIPQIAVTALALAGACEVMQTSDGHFIGVGDNETERKMLKHIYREEIPGEYRRLLFDVREIKRTINFVDNEVFSESVNLDTVKSQLESLDRKINHLEQTIELKSGCVGFYHTGKGGLNQHQMSGRID